MPVWAQVIQLQLRSVHRVHGQKRKAGLLFDVPLGGLQLAAAPKGVNMPPLRPTTDERRLQWMRVRSSTVLQSRSFLKTSINEEKVFECLATPLVCKKRCATELHGNESWVTELFICDYKLCYTFTHSPLQLISPTLMTYHLNS